VTTAGIDSGFYLRMRLCGEIRHLASPKPLTISSINRIFAGMARIMAIDYGLKRTGLAWTDPLQIIATGIGSVETIILETELKKLMASEVVEAIVLGYPTRGDGSDTDATAAVRTFLDTLKSWFPAMPVHLWDERFTSKMAFQSMIDAGLKQKKRRDKHLINEISATLILQEYLQQQ
jgi:putative Holliday junction resolvase